MRSTPCCLTALGTLKIQITDVKYNPVNEWWHHGRVSLSGSIMSIFLLVSFFVAEEWIAFRVFGERSVGNGTGDRAGALLCLSPVWEQWNPFWITEHIMSRLGLFLVSAAVLQSMWLFYVTDRKCLRVFNVKENTFLRLKLNCLRWFYHHSCHTVFLIHFVVVFVQVVKSNFIYISYLMTFLTCRAGLDHALIINY